MRFLHVSPSTVIRDKKKESQLQQVNLEALKQLNPKQVEVDIYLVQPSDELDGLESELDEMSSYVGKKDNARWLWHAIDKGSRGYARVSAIAQRSPAALCT